MTFEEWKSCPEQTYKGCWDAARKGMIPAKDAIVPDWEKFPGATGARIVYEHGMVSWKNSDWENPGVTQEFEGKIEIGEYYYAPTPPWSPKNKELVFLHANGSIHIGRAESEEYDPTKIDENTLFYIKSGTTEGWFRRGSLKPFDAEKVGKDWNEI